MEGGSAGWRYIYRKLNVEFSDFLIFFSGNGVGYHPFPPIRQNIKYKNLDLTNPLLSYKFYDPHAQKLRRSLRGVGGGEGGRGLRYLGRISFQCFLFFPGYQVMKLAQGMRHDAGSVKADFEFLWGAGTRGRWRHKNSYEGFSVLFYPLIPSPPPKYVWELVPAWVGGLDDVFVSGGRGKGGGGGKRQTRLRPPSWEFSVCIEIPRHDARVRVGLSINPYRYILDLDQELRYKDDAKKAAIKGIKAALALKRLRGLQTGTARHLPYTKQLWLQSLSPQQQQIKCWRH